MMSYNYVDVNLVYNANSWHKTIMKVYETEYIDTYRFVNIILTPYYAFVVSLIFSIKETTKAYVYDIKS